MAMPGVVVCMANCYMKQQAHEEHGHENPEFVPYPHLRIRTKVRHEPQRVIPRLELNWIRLSFINWNILQFRVSNAFVRVSQIR